jgi:hypothetical protein
MLKGGDGLGYAVFGNLEVVLGEGSHQVLVIVEHGRVQDHFIDITLQSVLAIITANRGWILGLIGGGILPIRGSHGIAVHIERRLLFRLDRRGRRRGYLRDRWARQAAKQENR